MVISFIVDMHLVCWRCCSFLYKITILCDFKICKSYLTNINSNNYVGGIILNQMIPYLCICDNKCKHSIKLFLGTARSCGGTCTKVAIHFFARVSRSPIRHFIYNKHIVNQCIAQKLYSGECKAPVTPDRTIRWSYDWLRFGQLRPIGNVCCDLLLRSHAVVYSLRLVVCHMLICMIIMYFYLLASIKQVYCK